MNKNTIIIILIVLALIVGLKILSSKSTTNVPVTVTPIATSTPSGVEYKNTKYGFTFSLPDSWKGFIIEEDFWEGYAPSDTVGQALIANGPLVFIRHPLWTEKNPRQDIPIMIFTISEWNDIQNDKFHIGAAPVGPKEITRNSKYVFAVQARYNFAFPIGFEEVEEILNSNPIKF